MFASLHAQAKLCAQMDPASSPDSMDTSISLIQTNFADMGFSMPENSVHAC